MDGEIDPKAKESPYIYHAEMEDGECMACHESSEPIAYDTDLSTVCGRCHSADFSKRHVHGPVAMGMCSACHDPHGSRSSTHLINFLRFDASGQEVVRPSLTTGRLEFEDLGVGRGRCYLNCHGEEHAPNTYIGNDEE